MKDGVSFIEGSYEDISNKVYELIKREGYKPEDILILCRERKDCESIQEKLNHEIRQK